jgi:BirA family transcriptional regulator, biotin operon repressor / biotin---[acetyl-CoA-carboxylase] ligase
MTVNGFFNILTRVDSTNNYAMGMVHARLAEHGMSWFAMEQTQGRGQRGKEWQSEPGQNLILSTVLRPDLLENQPLFSLSMFVAVTAHRFFTGLAGEDTRIKWPNDLYWRDRKAGGILIENVIQGAKWQWAVVGIGININQVVFNPQPRKPVSLLQITGKTYDPVALAKALRDQLLDDWAALDSNKLMYLSTQYCEKLYGLGGEVRLKKGSQLFSTRVTGVSPEGYLQTHDAINRHFSVGEVEWLSP